MNDRPMDIWKQRYRELERQFEFLLLNVAKSMSVLEEGKTDGSDSVGEEPEAKILKIVQGASSDGAFLYCVANGSNMEYRFEFIADKDIVQDTGFQRLNSSVILPEYIGLVDVCRVTVKSDSKGTRREITAHKRLNWNAK